MKYLFNIINFILKYRYPMVKIKSITIMKFDTVDLIKLNRNML